MFIFQQRISSYANREVLFHCQQTEAHKYLMSDMKVVESASVGPAFELVDFKFAGFQLQPLFGWLDFKIDGALDGCAQIYDQIKGVFRKGLMVVLEENIKLCTGILGSLEGQVVKINEDLLVQSERLDVLMLRDKDCDGLVGLLQKLEYFLLEIYCAHICESDKEQYICHLLLYEFIGKNIMNIKVDVNLDEIENGIILTMADQPLIKDNDINEDCDVLENEEVKQKDKLLFKQKVEEKKRKFNLPQKYDLDEFGNPKEILDKYDEIKLEKEGFFLDSSGKVMETTSKQSELITNKHSRQTNSQISLLFEDRVASDYKPQIPSTFVKKKIVKKAMENMVDVEAVTKHQVDPAEIEDDYTLLQKSIESKMRQKIAQNREDKVSLQQMMDQNRQLEEEKSKQLEEVNLKKANNEFVYPNPPSNRGEGQEIKVISNSTDFLSNVKTESDMQELFNRKISIKDTKNGTTSIVNVQLPTERIIKKKIIQEEENKELAEKEKPMEREEGDARDSEDQADQHPPQSDSEDVAFLEEASHGKGLADTLRILRERGELQPTTYDFVGRNRDKKRFSDLTQGDNEIRLEYRDASGRLMTPKEAFRYQCWTFHGEGPSKNKIEKRKRKDLIRRKQLQLKAGETPLEKAFKEQQKKDQTCYMIIGKKKCVEK